MIIKIVFFILFRKHLNILIKYILKKEERDDLLSQLTDWIELKQNSFSSLFQLTNENGFVISRHKTKSNSSKHFSYQNFYFTNSRVFQNEYDTMRDGYTLLKSIENLQNELRILNIDEDNTIITKLIEKYHEQLNFCDSSYIETISTLRRIQMNINKFDDS